MQLKKLLRLAINSNNIKQPHLILGSLMLIGLVLRLPSLSLGVWRDEGSTYFNALPLISDIEQRIQNKIHDGYRQLFFIQQAKVMSNYGKMKYSVANEVLPRLKRNYLLLEKTDYPGKNESITLYKFSLIKKE
jgi:hypothetical protein